MLLKWHDNEMSWIICTLVGLWWVGMGWICQCER